MSWNILRVDDRHYWDDAVQKITTACFSVYAFDRDSHTYCCSCTPTHALHFLGTEAQPIEGLSEETLERLSDAEIEADAGSEAVTYMSTYDVEKIAKATPSQVVDVHTRLDPEDDEDPVEQLRELWNQGALANELNEIDDEADPC